MGAGEAGAAAYARAGLKVLEIGDEAVLDVARVRPRPAPTCGRSGRPSHRLAAGRATRVRSRRHGDVAAEEMAELVELRRRVARHGETERGFSMALARLGDPPDGDCVLVEALDADGRLRGAALASCPWGRDGLSLDLMRRDPRPPTTGSSS